MINVHVSYTVKPGFAEQNKQNIAAFLADFKKLDTTGFRYDVFILDNGTTFLHASAFKNADIQKQILNVPSFLAFQKARDESGLNGSHKVEILQHVGSASEML